MRVLGRIFFICLAVVFVLLFKKTKEHFAGSFTVSKISTPLQWRTDVKGDGEGDVFDILNQKFRYLAMGNQVYVFESRDGQYVLKFLKQHTYRRPFWRKLVPWLNLKPRHIKKWSGGDKLSLLRALYCYKIAYEDAKDETGIVFVHLNKSYNRFPKITVYDRFGRSFLVNLDDVVFIIQKKVQPLHVVIKKLYQKNEMEKIEEIFRTYVKTDIGLLKKGIIDRDPGVHNAAIADGKIVRIDVGQFYLLRETASKELVWHDMRKMHLWLRRHAPDRVVNFEKIVKEEMQAEGIL